MQIEVLTFVIIKKLLIHGQILKAEIRESSQHIFHPHHFAERLNKLQLLLFTLQIINTINRRSNLLQMLESSFKPLYIIFIRLH